MHRDSPLKKTGTPQGSLKSGAIAVSWTISLACRERRTLTRPCAHICAIHSRKTDGDPRPTINVTARRSAPCGATARQEQRDDNASCCAGQEGAEGGENMYLRALQPSRMSGARRRRRSRRRSRWPESCPSRRHRQDRIHRSDRVCMVGCERQAVQRVRKSIVYEE